MEEAILLPVCRKLWQYKLHLIRVAGGFALLDEETIDTWGRPAASDVRKCAKPRRIGLA